MEGLFTMKRLLFTALLLCGGFIVEVSAGEQYAFLVGIGGYDEKQLRGLGEFPRADVIEFRDVLLASGFKPENIILMVDDLSALPKTGPAGRYLPEADKIRRELLLLLPALERDDTLIIALAGHGLQFKGDNVPFFCPLDARLDDKSTLLSLTWLYDKLKYDPETGTGCKPRQKLLLVDACRNDPAARLLRSSGGPELESVSLPQVVPLPEGIVALFSCAEGQQALQHEPLKHGIFFYHLLEGWKGKADGDTNGEITLDEIIAYTKSQTQTYARVKLAAPQTPRQKGYFDGTWVLRSIEAQPQRITNSIGMRLTLIPAGEFFMGSDETRESLQSAGFVLTRGFDPSDEHPRHRVRITNPFYLGVHEVTKGQFAEFVKAANYRTEAEKDGQGGWGYNESTTFTEQNAEFNWKNTGFSQTDSHPVVNITWNDASAFCEWLSAKEGKSYRLPSEAEWEYACRGGTPTRFFTGDGPGSLSGSANVQDAAFERKFPKVDYARYPSFSFDDGWAFTCPVGRFEPNRFGLYDMTGNVWEWCSDWYDKDYYKKSPVDDPSGAAPSSNRVFRGGCWVNTAGGCRSAYRSGDRPSHRGSSLGFRVVLSPSGG
jgi:formylglycine-generating enzyme required for sulfatase activity